MKIRSISRCALVSVVFFGILFGLCSCRLEDSYKEFFIDKISDYDVNYDIEEYMTLEEFDFARIDDIVIIPEIKEIHHGEYIIYISAFSKSGAEQVIVKTVSMEEGEKIFLNHELNLNIPLEKNQQGIYNGWIDGGTFTETDVEISDGKKLCLNVLVQVADETKEINYEIYIKGYETFVTPT